MTRAKRGKGTRRRVTSSGRLPHNWQDILRVDENKEELFLFLADKLKELQIPAGKQIFVTSKEDVFVYGDTDDQYELITHCNHEEADTHLFVHVYHAAQAEHSNFMIRTTDSDVVVLAVAVTNELKVKL